MAITFIHMAPPIRLDFLAQHRRHETMSIRKVVPISDADWRLEPVPSWVVAREPDWEFEGPEECAVVFLLVDEQHHVATQSISTRLVRRVLTRAAVQALGQVEIDFDPAAHRLRIHDLVVWRKDDTGAWQGRSVAHAVHFLVRQREQQLEQQMLNGRASVVALIEDLRVGDAIDLSWTLESRDSLPGLRFTTFHGFVWSIPVGATHFTLHLDPAVPVTWRLHCPEGIERPEHESAPDREQWNQRRPPLTIFEPNAPPGAWNFAVVEASAWASWNEVAEFTAALWAGALNDAADEIAEAAGRIQVHGDLAASVTEAIRFVQGEVRYLNVDFGHGAGLLPNGAGTVLRRRFGDCKDKTVLLTALLRRLGVEAWPLVVNPGWQGALTSRQPSLGVFNHVIVTFVVEGSRHFIDPTYVGQRGDLAHLVPPFYGFGLEIRPGATGLTPMPPRQEARLTLTETFHLDRKKQNGSVEQVLYATGWLADEVRGSIGRDGQAAFFKARIEALQNQFPALLPDEESGEIQEDPVSDAIELRDRHVLPTWGPKGEKPPDMFRYGAHGLFLAVEALEPPEERKMAWALRYPMRVQHLVVVKGRCIRRAKPEKHRHSGPGFRYSCDVSWQRGAVVFDYLWETTAAKVKAEEWPDYCRERGKAFEHAGANVVTKSFWASWWQNWGIVTLSIGLGLTLGVLGVGNDRRNGPSKAQDLKAAEREVQAAWEQAGAGNYAAAEPVFERHQASYAKNPAFQLMRAETAIRQGHPDRAAQALEMARRLAPEDAGCDLIQALLLRNQGNPAGARELLLGATQRHPKDARLWRELAQTLTQLGDLERARKAWERVLGLRPGHPEALGQYATLVWESGDRERANSIVTGTLAAQPTPSELLEREAGRFFTSTGQFDLAAEHQEKAMNLAPENPAGGFEAAMANLRAGRTARALELAERYARDFPQSTGSWHALAVVKSTAGDRAGAEQAFQELLRIAPHDPLTHSNWGFFLHQSGRTAEAKIVLAAAAAQFPGEAMVWVNYSEVLEALGESEAAAAAKLQADRLLTPAQRQSMIR